MCWFCRRLVYMFVVLLCVAVGKSAVSLVNRRRKSVGIKSGEFLNGIWSGG